MTLAYQLMMTALRVDVGQIAPDGTRTMRRMFSDNVHGV